MLIVLEDQLAESHPSYQSLLSYLRTKALAVLPVSLSSHTELYIEGELNNLDAAALLSQPAVKSLIPMHSDCRILGRHQPAQQGLSFTYNSVEFSQSSFHVFAGLCAVDTRAHVEKMMQALSRHGQQCTRMGAYKPRSSPYSFQGHGKDCLPYVFELAGKYGIKVIAMEVMDAAHITAINAALEDSGHPTGVMLQIGTRNSQNFSLLKAVGQQRIFPVLFKRGFGITLSESLLAAEYIARSGNPNVIFCLRGVKSALSHPHRNLADFAQIPVVNRLTRMPVCIDPSHSIGTLACGVDHIPDIFHATAQGVIAGANMVLVDFHPDADCALVDGHQALPLKALEYYLDDIALTRETYLQRQTRHCELSAVL